MYGYADRGPRLPPPKKPGGTSGVVVYPFEEKRVAVYHSLLGRPQLVAFDSLGERDAFIALLRHGPADSGFAELDAILSVTDNDARTEIARRRGAYLGDVRQRLNYLSLLTSEACNLGCSYCIAGRNMETAATRRAVTMKWEVARRAVDWYFSQVRAGVVPYVNFSGGEPLLNWRLVSRILAYVRETYPAHSERTRFSINTNATLITPDVARTLKEHRVIVATSLDGTPAASDLVRISKRNRLGVSDTILRGWRELANVGHPLTGFMATFSDRNFSALNEGVVEFAHEMGFRWVRVDCDVIHLLAVPVDEVIERLWRVYLRGKDLGIAVEGFWSTAMHNLLAAESADRRDSGGERACAGFFCGAVSGETVSVHPDGRVSACGFSGARLGDVSRQDPIDVEGHLSLVASYFPGQRDSCRGCLIEGSCAGGCNIAREESTVTGSQAVIEYNCGIYREMTRRLLLDYFSDPSNSVAAMNSSGARPPPA